MVNKLTKICDKIIEYIKETAQFRQYSKYKELVEIEKKEALLAQFNNLKHEIVNLKAYGLVNQLAVKEKEYQMMKNQIENDIVLSYYLEAQEDLRALLSSIFNSISQKIAYFSENGEK